MRFFYKYNPIENNHMVIQNFGKNHQELKQLLEKDLVTGSWKFHVKYLGDIERILQDESFCVLITIPLFLKKMIGQTSPVHFKDIRSFKKIHKINDNINNNLPLETKNALFEYQYDTLIYAHIKKKLLIADDPGLGKTLQSICISALFRENWPVLVVCPSSVKKMWANEYMKWLNIDESDIKIMDGKDMTLSQINIISYGMLHKIDHIKFDFIICDESHSIKTYNSKRTKLLSPMLKRAERVLLLSGTPALSNALELLTQISVLFNTYIDYHEYADRYCHKEMEFNRIKYYGYKNLDELHNILNESVMIRRIKSDIITDIPEKNRHKIHLELPVEKLKEFDELKRELDQNENIFTKKFDMMTLFRKIGELKVDSVIEYFSKYNVYDEKIIIFAHHLHILEKIEDILIKKNIKYINIQGSTKSTERQKLIDNYQDTMQDIQVALLSLTAAGVGITLTAAKKVYFTELYWTPGLLLQAEDRAHRHGQTDKVNIYYMIAKNTIDEAIWRTISHKMKFCTNTFDGKVKKLEIHSIIENYPTFDFDIFEKIKSYKRQKRVEL